MIYVLSLIGVAVFAISGAIAAGRRNYDWVGVAVVAFVTALGGGTLRDILLNRQVFWIEDPTYLWVMLGACAATLAYVGFIKPPYWVMLVADGLGLALFTLSGAEIAERQLAASIVIVLMGAITGSAGGVFRDILLFETPVLFRSDETLYSLTSVFGVTVYLAAKQLGIDQTHAFILGIVSVASLRFAAIFWNIKLPAFQIPDRAETRDEARDATGRSPRKRID